LSPGWSLQSPGGVGLSVTRERISSMHPDLPGHLALHRRTEGGTEVEISLPLRFTEKDRDGAIV
jgi:two-component system, LytTR family, sensor kinase